MITSFLFAATYLAIGFAVGARWLRATIDSLNKQLHYERTLAHKLALRCKELEDELENAAPLRGSLVSETIPRRD